MPDGEKIDTDKLTDNECKSNRLGFKEKQTIQVCRFAGQFLSGK
jgi:hypothetical protein